jgi:gliding motility-associated-like protein
MRLIFLATILLVFVHKSYSQDNCSNARALCANSTITATTLGGTTVGSDPALACGDGVVHNSTWFTINAFNAGPVGIVLSNIDSANGLAMQIYTGTCGALVSTGVCTSATNVQGSMSVNFNATANTTYYIMVDGNNGNQESFTIQANSTIITARPDANFLTNPVNGCTPLNVLLDNTTTILGGTNITYQWRIDGGSLIAASGADTNIILTTTGPHNIELRVCNFECGCKSVVQEVIAQDLITSITATPPTTCLGTNMDFTATAQVIPDPPTVNPNVTVWQWNFNDPNSGANNIAFGQNVSHTFEGPQTSFTVQLIALGTCGPDTSTLTLNLSPRIDVSMGAPQLLCEGDPVSLNTTSTNAANPIQNYNYTGPGSFSCTNCANPNIVGLAVGGPYNYAVTITDNNGCTADTITNITIRPKPAASVPDDTTVCDNTSLLLDATITTGIAPFTYAWATATGLNNSTIEDPTATITGNVTYCLTVTDSAGCASDPSCLDITIFQPPTVSPNPASLCASAPDMNVEFTVAGFAIGSTIYWSNSADFGLIAAANADSSQVTVSFPPSIAASYSFTIVVIDAITGCSDTIVQSYAIDPGLTFSLSGGGNICEGATISLTASGATDYLWTSNNGYLFSDSTAAIQNVSPVATTTFTVTGTTGQCSATQSVTVNVSPLPIAAAAPLPDFCGCDTVVLNGAGSTLGMNYQWSSQNSNLIVNDTGIFAGSLICSSDVFTLTVTDPLSNCAATATTNAFSAPKPIAAINLLPNVICDGVSTNIVLDGSGSDTNPGTTYLWSNTSGITITDSTLIQASANVNTTTIFSLLVTDALGCDTIVTDTVNIHPIPNITAFNPFICTSDPTLTATITVNGAGAGSQYVWNTIPGCALPNAANDSSQLFDFSSCGAGIYGFDIEVTDGITGCISQVSASVTVVNGVTLNVTPAQTICEGNAITIGATGANTYLWSNGDTTATISLTNLTAINSPYQFIVSGTIGTCSAVDTISVIVNPTPTPVTINGPTNVCEGDTNTIYTITANPGSNYTWDIVGGTFITSINSDTVYITWDSAGQGIIQLYDTNSFNCGGPPTSLLVTINSNPDSLIITGIDSTCENTQLAYNVNPTAGSTYLWNAINGGLVSGTAPSNINVIWNAAGLGFLNVIETNAAGCSGPPAQIQVAIYPIPVPFTIIGDTVFCINDSTAQYIATGDTNATFTWTATGGNIVSGQGTDTIIVDWTSSGINQIAVVEQSFYGCTGLVNTMNVQVDDLPIVSVTPDSTTLCANSVLLLNGQQTNATVLWSTNGSGTFSDTTNSNTSYTPSLADTNGVLLLLIGTNGACPADTATVYVDVLPTPIATATALNSSICFGSVDTLIATGGDTYYWLQPPTVNDTLIVNPTVTTAYTVIVYNAFGCNDTADASITVIPPGIPNAGSDGALCIGDSLLLNGSVINAPSLVWTSNGDGYFNPDSVTAAAYYVPGPLDTLNGIVTVTATSVGACLNLADSLMLTLSSVPFVFAGNDTTIENNQSIPLNGIVTNASGGVWTTTGTGNFIPSDTSLVATYQPSEADYELDSLLLTLTTVNGCTTLVDQLKIDFTGFYIPNVFTPYPNTPGFNDFFEIKRLPKNSAIIIYDRWGLIVYKSENYLNNWDARELNGDMYYYELSLADTRKYKGFIKVIR